MTVIEENLRILKWIQSQGSSGTDQYFEYVCGIGDKLEFQIRVKGGQLGGSDPDEMLSNLSDYKSIAVEIFESTGKLEPRSLDNYLDIWKMNTKMIFPKSDDRFSSQYWVKDNCITKSIAGSFSLACYLIVSPDMLCDIVRHCQKLVGLKAFW